jgi:hypothetical protein
VLGLSTTAMTADQPRYSTSEDLLAHAPRSAERDLQCDTRLIRFRELRVRECEGFYSKSARACTWPCSITQMDSHDQMEQVYEGVVHWADVILVATPIRWSRRSCAGEAQCRDGAGDDHQLAGHRCIGEAVTPATVCIGAYRSRSSVASVSVASPRHTK